MPFLDEKIFKKYKKTNIKFLDAFAGTTVISKYLQDNYKFEQYLSDFSDYTEILASRLFINLCSEDIIIHIEKIFNISNSLEKTESGIIYNEFSIGGTPSNLNVEVFHNQSVQSRMFFTDDVGIKIDTMRAYIKTNYNQKNINTYDKNLLLMIVLAFADKNANTTSVYGAYLKNQNKPTVGLKQDFFDILKQDLNSNLTPPKQFFKGDIIDTLNIIPEMDVIYCDPPYNTRKYESNYHILNYLSNLEFSVKDIKENSKTGLPKIKIKNLFGSKKDTRIIFNDIIIKGMNKSENLFISYSSESEMTFEEIQEICNKNNFKLTVYSQDYKKYKSSNINQDKNLKELIYHIKRN